MKYVSICSGIEAATVAFHPLGWTPLAFAEIEAFPSALLAQHYSAVPNLGDMTKFLDWPEELLAECDLLVGGPPCQSFSIAGLRNSLADERGNLTLAYVKLINHIDSIRRKHGRDPIIALYENVPGIYSTKDNAFGCLVGAVCGQDAPVETETGKWPTTGVFWGEKRRVGYRTLDAQYFGLAQRRRRCFLLAVPNDLVERLGDRACPSEILSIAESLRGDSPPSRQAGERPALYTGRGTPSGSHWDDALNPHPSLNQSANAGGVGGSNQELFSQRGAYLVPGGCDIMARFQTVVGDASADVHVAIAIQERAICENPNAGPDGAGFRTDGVAYTLEARTVPQAVAFPACMSGTQYASTEGLCPSLGALNPTAVAFDLRGREGGAQLEGPHDTANIRAASGGSSRSYIATRYAVRRLTPEECEKLQGFPVGYTKVPYRGKPVIDCADGNRYRALGNSFAVPVVRWIGQRIEQALGLAA